MYWCVSRNGWCLQVKRCWCGLGGGGRVMHHTNSSILWNSVSKYFSLQICRALIFYLFIYLKCRVNGSLFAVNIEDVHAQTFLPLVNIAERRFVSWRCLIIRRTCFEWIYLQRRGDMVFFSFIFVRNLQASEELRSLDLHVFEECATLQIDRSPLSLAASINTCSHTLRMSIACSTRVPPRA